MTEKRGHQVRDFKLDYSPATKRRIRKAIERGEERAARLAGDVKVRARDDLSPEERERYGLR